MASNHDTAVIESASAAGLGLLGLSGATKISAVSSSTVGVGELIRAALDGGVRRIVVGIGGTATTDGGAGALTALGARILDGAGAPVPRGATGLEVATTLDCSGLDPRLAQAELVVACDVDSPLLGPTGAARVFGPQKGATPSIVTRLDAALARWADVTAVATTRDLRHLPGMGAGGGLAFGLAAVLGARLESGATMLMHFTGLAAALDDAKLVVVGEGSLDLQSLQGKAPIAVARLAASRGIPVVALVGRSFLDRAQIAASGLVAVHALADLDPNPHRQLSRAAELLEQGGRLLGERYL